MTEEDLFIAVANAESNFAMRQYDRMKNGKDWSIKNGLDRVFQRWLAIHYGIIVNYDLSELFNSTCNDKPWRKSHTYCSWYVESYKDDEMATMFKLKFG